VWEIKKKNRLLFSLILAFLFISVDILSPAFLNSFIGDIHYSVVYAAGKSGGFKSSSGFSSSKSSSGSFKSGSYSTPKSFPGSSSSSKSSSGGFKSGSFSNSSGKAGGSSTSQPNYNSGGTNRSILPIPIPIPWGSGSYGSSYGGYFGPIQVVGSIFSGFIRLILTIIVLVVIFKIIRNSRRY
jgi:hypothetical protein